MILLINLLTSSNNYMYGTKYSKANDRIPWITYSYITYHVTSNSSSSFAQTCNFKRLTSSQV